MDTQNARKLMCNVCSELILEVPIQMVNNSSLIYQNNVTAVSYADKIFPQHKLSYAICCRYRLFVVVY